MLTSSTALPPACRISPPSTNSCTRPTGCRQARSTQLLPCQGTDHTVTNARERVVWDEELKSLNAAILPGSSPGGAPAAGAAAAGRPLRRCQHSACPPARLPPTPGRSRECPAPKHHPRHHAGQDVGTAPTGQFICLRRGRVLWCTAGVNASCRRLCTWSQHWRQLPGCCQRLPLPPPGPVRQPQPGQPPQEPPAAGVAADAGTLSASRRQIFRCSNTPPDDGNSLAVACDTVKAY